ncbi:MAG: hypothetical protein KDC53_14225 [Saprospiraceae bacterium]|nr:hypothetical protein [Saprospiraceae bacterium]
MNDRFDQHLRTKIYAVESDVPDHLWSAVELQLRPKKNRRRWILLLLLLVPAGVWYWSAANQSAQELTPMTKSLTSQLSSVKSPEDPDRFKEAAVELSQKENKIAEQQARSGFVSANKKSIAEPLANFSRNSKVANPFSNGSPAIDSDINPVLHQPLNNQSLQKNEKPLLLSEDAFTSLEEIRFSAIPIADPKIDICPSFSNSMEIKPFVEFGFQAGLPQKMLSNHDPELQDYKNLRERTEREKLSASVSGLVGLDIGNRLEIKTGLSSTRIFEVFDYIDESATRTITNIITDTILVNGEQKILTDTTVVTQYGQRIKYSQNRYTTLDLPLFVAYKFKVRNHQLLLQAGAIYNLRLWAKGDILSPDEEIVELKKNNTIYNKSSGFDLMAALGYELNLSEGNHLRILCSLRQNFGDFSAPQYPLSQRYKHIHIGVSWKHQL